MSVKSVALQSGQAIFNSFTISSNLLVSVLSHAYHSGCFSQDSILLSTNLSALCLDLHHLQSIRGSAKPPTCHDASQTFGFIIREQSINILSVLF
jgi:hypothetical protein